MTDVRTRTRQIFSGWLQEFVRPVLFTVAALLLFAGVGAWWFSVGEGNLIAVSMSILVLVLGLAAVGIRLVAGSQPPARTGPSGWAGQDAANAEQDTVPLRGSAPVPGDPGLALGTKRWSLDVFASIDAQRFAAVCETWFSWAGFDTRTQAHRTDGGVDIWLHAARMPGPVAIVRCKHWFNQPVGLQEMKEFLGVVANHQSAHGTYTTTSTYTPEALQFAREHGIDAVDGRGLLRRIQTRTRQRQQALLAVACSGQA